MRLPAPNSQGVDEPTAHYGARLLMFIVAEDITATLDDSQLELALHATIRFKTEDTCVYECIHQTKLTIMAALAGRKQIQIELAKLEEMRSKLKGTPGTSPVPLSPLPKTNPPANQKQEVPF